MPSTPPNQARRTDWNAVARAAILDLLQDRLVVPWHEVEARIASHGWKTFKKAQPLQLTEARKQLLSQGQIVLEHTRHTPPVVTVRVPTHSNNKELARLRGARRRLYRRYLKWTGDERLCGKHAENVVHQTAIAHSSQAGIWVPPQSLGRVTEVLGHSIAPQTLDMIAHALDPATASRVATLIIEVKNIRSWVYPWDEELWQLLSYGSALAQHIPVVPVLVCPRAAYLTYQMAQDVGFLLIQIGRQIFHPDIPPDEFQEIIDEFALVIERYAGPTDEHVANFLTSTLRRSPPPTPPFGEDIPWFQRQAQRFAHLAPVIHRFSSLAGFLDPDDGRPRVWDAARGALKATISWPQVAGW